MNKKELIEKKERLIRALKLIREAANAGKDLKIIEEIALEALDFKVKKEKNYYQGQKLLQKLLLDACKFVLEQRGHVGKHSCPGADCVICTTGWGIIEDAIAKAEGKKEVSSSTE